jgi:hypothetical protein
MLSVSFEDIGAKAFSARAFDPYNSADTSAKWLVMRWADDQDRCDCGARDCVAFSQNRFKLEANRLYGKFVQTKAAS